MMKYLLNKLIGKVLAEEFAIFKIKLSFLTHVPLQTQLWLKQFTGVLTSSIADEYDFC